MVSRRLKRYLAGIAGVLAVAGAYTASLAKGPDLDISFEREVPFAVPAETIGLSILAISNWSQWFFSLERAERIDLLERTMPVLDQKVEEGALIRLLMQPHRGEHRGAFELRVKVVRFVPGQLLVLRLVEDRAGRISRLVDSVEWKIEVLPAPAGSAAAGGILRGTETAHTHHWRARVLGQVAGRILMNQLFYPDLMALAHFTQPKELNPYPVYGQ